MRPFLNFKAVLYYLIKHNSNKEIFSFFIFYSFKQNHEANKLKQIVKEQVNQVYISLKFFENIFHSPVESVLRLKTK